MEHSNFVKLRWRIATVSLWIAVFAGGISAQSTIFVVRHADRYGTEPDPDITPEGQRQATSLARLLADTHITRIFTTEAVRTQQTAAPTALQFHVKPVIIDSTEFDDLIRKVRTGLRD